jgi:transketolase
MRNTFVNCLLERAKIDEKLFVMTADMGYSVFEDFQKLFPDRFFNVGIAEQNCIGIASGLALSGFNVYVYSIIPFITMRCYEQIRIDVAYMKNNVKIIGNGAGMSYGASGATHHAIEDIAIMRVLPNMTVCCPGCTYELNNLLELSFDYIGPMYFRLGRCNSNDDYYPKNVNIQVGKAVQLTEGYDITVISTSTMLETTVKWVSEWQNEGLSVGFFSMHTIKPIDKETILKIIEKSNRIITIEEHNIYGGLGSAVAEIVADEGKAIKLKRVGVNDRYSHYVGNHEFIKGKFGLENKPDLKDFIN